MSRKELLAKLMLQWSRTIEEHKIGDFNQWLAQKRYLTT